jgi:N-methylhydantoinase A
MRFAVDTGGTFTDLVIEDSERLRLFKAPTTPGNPVDGVLDVLTVAAEALGRSRRDLLGEGDLFVHGTTTATNSVITGRTARTAFLTTEGHPDVLVLREGGRIGLPLFNYSIPYPQPYVPRSLTFEVPERIAADGEIVRPLDEAAARVIVRRLEDERVDAVAVCLLWSIVNPAHERQLESLIAERLPDVAVSLSHRVNPSLREYRRASATAIDVSLKPIMSRYLQRLESRLREEGYGGRLLIVTSQGMTKDAGEVAASPVHAVKSGPAMAPVAGRHYAQQSGLGDTAIIADTGGTTYDVALVRHGEIPETRETWIGRPYIGHMTGFPSIDIRSVGSGGGSVACVDAGGLLRVGPESMGASPGPACYGAGGERATVTDAALALGYLDPDNFLGGRMRLDPALSQKAIKTEVAVPLGIGVETAALAILALATETMAGAIEDITVNQGIDPRGATLIGGGGAAGLNSVAIARRLGCRHVLFPDAGAAISAVGGLLCPLSDDNAEFHLANSRAFDRDAINEVLERLEKACLAFVERVEGGGSPAIAYSVEARYAQQIWEIKLPLRVDRFRTDGDAAEAVADFHRLHEEVFAFQDADAEVEFVNWRARVSCDLRQGPLGHIVSTARSASLAGTRQAWFGDAWREVPVHDFLALPDGKTVEGPAIVETPLTTIVVDPDASFRRDERSGLVVAVRSAQERQAA